MTFPILPAPKTVRRQNGSWSFHLRSHHSAGWTLNIECDTLLVPQAQLLAAYLTEENLIPVAINQKGPTHIHLQLNELEEPSKETPLEGFVNESYQLHIHPDTLSIHAVHPHGIARGIQSLRQLISGQRAKQELPCGVVEDAPATIWRGLHLDVARHFMSVAEVLRFIDLAAYHKYNVFHWHLTDDQGWRLPMDGYPKLQSVAAWREGTLIGHDCNRDQGEFDGVPHGGYYTHDEIRQVVEYAAVRGIHVLPEVDVPGHVQALITAYPELGCTGKPPGVRMVWGISPHTLNLEPETFRFLEAMIDTVVNLFPFPYIHLGGDEAETDEWAASPTIQARKREWGIESDKEIQMIFTRKLGEWAAARQRRFIGWDEIVDSGYVPERAAVMFWRDQEKDTPDRDLQIVKQGIPLICTHFTQTYLCQYQQAGPGKDTEPLAITDSSSLTLEQIYEWDFLQRFPADQRHLVLGAQAQVWTEYIPNRRLVDYMVFPRACALSQVLWSGTPREPLSAFMERLEEHLPRLDRLDVAYRPLNPKG